MNFKKMAVTGAAAALLLSSAIPALAYDRHERGGEIDVEVDNHASVRNNVLTLANSGFNEVGGSDHHRSRGYHNSGAYINTGDAWAETGVYNDVNYTSVNLCGCLTSRHGSDLEIEVDNHASVKNNVLTVANSGFNDARSGRIRTGEAGAGASVENFVNTTFVGGGSEE